MSCLSLCCFGVSEAVDVFVHRDTDSLEAIATLTFSCLSVKVWKWLVAAVIVAPSGILKERPGGPNCCGGHTRRSSATARVPHASAVHAGSRGHAPLSLPHQTCTATNFPAA